jgi:hypothetical protein
MNGSSHGPPNLGESGASFSVSEVHEMDKKAKTPKKPKQIKPKGSGTAK